MLNPNLWFLKSLPLRNRALLPTQSGIYYACDRRGRVRYVGMSTNLFLRWNGKGDRVHHKLRELEKIDSITLRYRLVPKHRLEYEEAIDIEYFQPDLNRSFPDPREHKTLRISLENLIDSIGIGATTAILALAILQLAGAPMLAEIAGAIHSRIEEARSQ